MNIEEIRREIEQLLSLAAQWEQNGTLSQIERDLALTKLSRLYEALKFASAAELSAFEPTSELSSEPTPALEAEGAVEQEPIEAEAEVAEQPRSAEEPAFDDSIYAIDIEGVSIVQSDDQVAAIAESAPTAQEPQSEEQPASELEPELVSEPTSEPTSEPISEPTIEPAPAPEPIEEQPQKSSDGATLFGIDIAPRRSRNRRSVLMSLYNDPTDSDKPQNETREQPTSEQSTPKQSAPAQSTPEQVAPAQQVAATPTPRKEYSVFETMAVSEAIETPVPILGEALASEVETVGDRLAGVVHHTVISDRLPYNSFDDLGINERYMLAHELFGDDPQLCRQELIAIGEFDNYDDAVIYIAENFNWRADSDGAKLLLAILEKKFNIS